MSAPQDAATVSSGKVSDPYVPGTVGPPPPGTSMCCGASGTGSGVIEYTAPANTAPNFTPDTPSAIAINTTDGQQYTYFGGAWH